MKEKLIFDPVNRSLSESNGRVLKYIKCPQLKDWQNLALLQDGINKKRFCDACERSVLSTENMTVNEIIDLLNDNPEQCVHLSLDQDNIEVKVKNAKN